MNSHKYPLLVIFFYKFPIYTYREKKKIIHKKQTRPSHIVISPAF